MAKTKVSRRGVKGGKRPDTQQMKEWLAKGHMVTSLGVVRKFPEHDSHFEINTEDGRTEVLVDVELVPSSTRVMCRLGFGHDQIFKIPRVDQEVAVLIPFDPQSLIKDPLDFDPIIVGVLDVAIPSQLDDDDITVIATPRVKILSTEIEIGDSPGAQEGAVVGTGIDSFTGSTYFALGNASGITKIKK